MPPEEAEAEDIATPSSTTEPIPITSTENQNLNPNLITPVRRPFPVAKPFAQRMIHAYSPARPSPLSRILMLADSPNTPDGESSSRDDINVGLEAVHESDESPCPTLPETPKPQQPQMSLAAELGVESPPDVVEVVEEVPLRERKTEMNGRAKVSSKPTGKGAVAEGGRKPSAGIKERPKSRSSSDTTRGVAATTSGRTSSGMGVEKENARKVSGKTSTTSATAASSTTRVVSGAKSAKPTAGTKVNGVASTTAASRSKAVSKPASTSATATAGVGPRRVPVNSAEAPPIARRKS